MSFLKKVGKVISGNVGSIISGATGLLGGAQSASGQREANRMNYKIARENREFQKMMSDTAVRRRMADMKRAGINPILAATYDASTPAGAVATMGNVGAAAVQGFQQGAGTASQVVKMGAEVDNLKASTNMTNSQAQVISGLAVLGGTLGEALTAVKNFITGFDAGEVKEVVESFNQLPRHIKDSLEEVLREMKQKYAEGVKYAEDWMDNMSMQFQVKWRQLQDFLEESY